MATLTERSARERQRLGWTVLFASFFLCMVITVAVPVGVATTLQNATERLDVRVQANKGTVRIDNANGEGGALLVGEPGRVIEPGSSIFTGNSETALVSFAPPDDEQRLVRLQVYSNTILRLEVANTPQFSVSDKAHNVVLKVESGRLQVAVSEQGVRPLSLQFNTPQARIVIDEPGDYSLIVANEGTQFSVQQGEATVTAVAGDAQPASLTLLADQRAQIPTGQPPLGPLPTERNLIANNDFRDGKEKWTFFSWRVERADQPRGTSQVVNELGELRLEIVREGVGHADLWIRQTLQEDVTDLSSLNLALTFRIVSQSLDVCGVKGSECPLFIRINYIDENGVSQTWQHGFYASGEVVDGTTPDACISCAVVQSKHERVPPLQDYFYEVDLRTELARQGFLPPRFIESLELGASGHSFEVEIVSVDLLAQE